MRVTMFAFLVLTVACSSHSEPADAGTDAGADAGTDAGVDAGTDAGADAGTDAGVDAGTDAGADAGIDAGCAPGQSCDLAPICTNSATMRTFSKGSCDVAGYCQHPFFDTFVDRVCGDCVDGRCTNPCTQSMTCGTCSAAIAPRCIGPSELLACTDGGGAGCYDGMCSYDAITTNCPNGCDAGRCN